MFLILWRFSGKCSRRILRTVYDSVPGTFCTTHSAVKSFGTRIMTTIIFEPMATINGSVEVTVQYMTEAAKWINTLVQKAQQNKIGLLPFQFDLCIAVGEPGPEDNGISEMENGQKVDDENGDDHSDNEDLEEEEEEYVDYIGNIEQKLKNNKLKYSKKEISLKSGVGRVFHDLFQQFLQENPEQNPRDTFSYLNSKRLISMIDRRHQKVKVAEATDSIFMYEPPVNSQIIPANAVPEWYLASSRVCLLPALDVCSRYIPRTASNHKFVF